MPFPSGSTSDKPAGAAARRAAWVVPALGLVAGAIVLAIIAGYHEFGGRPSASIENAAGTYVGGAVCAQCHGREATAWRQSHHALAMQKAMEETVLGDFNDASFAYNGTTSRFFRKDGKFFVNTDGRNGVMADFEIAYTFGVYPLQQYLIAFPDGRLQALGIAWDARPKEEGGQHWFHLYPGQAISRGDELHWTGINQNWNFMCAECHSTDLHKIYDPAQDRFRTTWSDIDVSCEACHGPGSRHIAWAQSQHRWWWPISAGDEQDKGLSVIFNERAGVSWTVSPTTGAPERSALQPLRIELETCGRCHSRRAEISEEWLPGRSLSSTHIPALLERRLYYADGQIEEEVYEYGSFRQSKMFAKGVTCSDCHDPHSLERRAAGDSLCLQCHAAEKYATAKHNFHAVTPALACTSCHMPARTYMVVHVRHDHSFRVPRPDLSKTLSTPNACNDCHKDKSPDWAAAAIERWFGPEREGFQNFGDALHAARKELPEAHDLLLRVALDPQSPGIARATAYAEMGPYIAPDLIAALIQGLSDPDPLVRLGALRALEGVDPARRWALAAPLLSDPVRAMRVEATSLLAPVPSARLSPEERARFERGAEEFVRVQRFNADRPEARVTLGAFFAERGQAQEAEAEYRAAIKLDPRFVQAYVNLADLYRGLDRDREGEMLLRQALSIGPGDAVVYHALGLVLVRQHRIPEATEMLAKAASLDPERSRYAYVYAIALSSSGRQEDALRLLAENQARHPADRDTLAALIRLNREAGDRAAALRYAELLARLSPGDPQVAKLLDELR
jgi:Flp pilus assembly protein TadD